MRYCFSVERDVFAEIADEEVHHLVASFHGRHLQRDREDERWKKISPVKGPHATQVFDDWSQDIVFSCHCIELDEVFLQP